ncbi:hypothetical protein [Streptomyces sp. NPDC093094]|uniref:hypothetical protein n=1 Tax=Streptomyces sp. NPDC093094 TaxID=3366026 RepID=UPI0038169220
MRASSVAQRHVAGETWLARCTQDPDFVRAEWDADRLVPFVSGVHWLVAETSVVHGLPAASRIPEALRGPVLADPYADRAWWLVPLDADEDLAGIRQVTVHPTGWALRCPAPGWEIDRRYWLWRPDGSGRLTDSAVLAAALGPGGCRLLGRTA